VDDHQRTNAPLRLIVVGAQFRHQHKLEQFVFLAQQPLVEARFACGSVVLFLYFTKIYTLCKFFCKQDLRSSPPGDVFRLRQGGTDHLFHEIFAQRAKIS